MEGQRAGVQHIQLQIVFLLAVILACTVLSQIGDQLLDSSTGQCHNHYINLPSSPVEVFFPSFLQSLLNIFGMVVMFTDHFEIHLPDRSTREVQTFKYPAASSTCLLDVRHLYWSVHWASQPQDVQNGTLYSHLTTITTTECLMFNPQACPTHLMATASYHCHLMVELILKNRDLQNPFLHVIK